MVVDVQQALANPAQAVADTGRSIVSKIVNAPLEFFSRFGSGALSSAFSGMLWLGIPIFVFITLGSGDAGNWIEKIFGKEAREKLVEFTEGSMLNKALLAAGIGGGVAGIFGGTANAADVITGGDSKESTLGAITSNLVALAAVTAVTIGAVQMIKTGGVISPESPTAPPPSPNGAGAGAAQQVP